MLGYVWNVNIDYPAFPFSSFLLLWNISYPTVSALYPHDLFLLLSFSLSPHNNLFSRADAKFTHIYVPMTNSVGTLSIPLGDIPLGAVLV